MSFTVVPLHGFDLGAGLRIPFGNGFVLQDIPAWLRADQGILSKIHLNDRQLIEQDRHALVAEYDAEAMGSSDPEWPGEEPRSIQALKFQSAMLANLAMWLRQPSTVCFTVGFHALSRSQPIILATEHHTRLFCHPKDADNPIYPHHLTRAADLHRVLATIPRQNAVWAALRAFWAALTSYAGDLRYPLFWQGLESLFGSEEKTCKVTVRLCKRLSSFLSEDEATRQINYSKAEACYDARSKIIHGRWDAGAKIDQLMADTEAIARTAMRHVLERPGMLDTFTSERRDEFLEGLV